MGNYLMMQIYIDKNKDMIFVPYKECKIGYTLAVEPYKKIGNVEWDNVSRYIVDMIREIAIQPQTENTETNVMKQLCGKKGFKQFSQKHICIEVDYKISDKIFIISNIPRLPDGSYGVEKNSLSEQYCIKHISTDDVTLIQESFIQACGDAEQYLQKIGSKL